MAAWLIKTEPSEYSWDDLVREKGTVWQGVTNNAALLHLRGMKTGDEAFIYHTGDERRVVGLARIAKGPYPDPDLEPRDEKRVVVDVKPLKKANSPVTLASIKADERFGEFALVKQSRLSVMPVPEKMASALKKLAGL